MRGFSILLLLLAYVVTYAASRELSLPISVTQPKKNSINRRKHYRNAPLPPQDAENQLENVVSQASISSSNIYGPLCIFGGTLVHLTLGTLYCWGNFLSYAPQFLKFYDGLEHKGVQPDALIVLPLTILSMCVSMPLGPTIVKAIGASKTLLLGSWIMSLGVFLASYAKSLSTFLAFYAIMFGTGVGLAYTAPMVAGWKWMPQQKGLVSGIILTGFGAGGFFFNLIGTHLVNPNSLDVVNGKFPDEVYNSFPSMLRKLAVIYGGLQLVGALLVSEPKAQPKRAEQSTVAGAAAPVATVATAAAGVSILDALKTSQFWLLWLMIVSSASAGLNVAAVYKQFAANAPALSGDGYQALVGGIGALCNGFGRLFWGALSDKVGFKTSFISLTLLQSLLHLSYPFSAVAKMPFLVATGMCFFCLAGNFALMPPATQRIFGTKNGASIYGLLYSAFAFASIGGLVLSKTLVASLGWGGIFKVLASLSAVAALLVLNLQPLKQLPSSQV